MLLVLASSCKKDQDEMPAVTKENLAGTYTPGTVMLKLGAAPEADVTNDYVEPCMKDDMMSLNVDLTYAYSDAGTKCSAAGDESGTWALPNASSITIDGETFTIVKYDGKVLQVSQTDTYMGQAATLTLTWNKK
jgi:hypothetical protein